MELAQAYFPAILPRSAWKKLKALLMDDPQTASYGNIIPSHVPPSRGVCHLLRSGCAVINNLHRILTL